MITNGKDKPFGTAAIGLPNMSEALSGWMQPMKFGVICSQSIDGLVQEIVQWVNTKGVRQPFSAQKLMIKPEGQRAWRWETLHCLPDVLLKPNDDVLFEGVKYRVMQKYDYKEYGYLQYDITQDFQGC